VDWTAALQIIHIYCWVTPVTTLRFEDSELRWLRPWFWAPRDHHHVRPISALNRIQFPWPLRFQTSKYGAKRRQLDAAATPHGELRTPGHNSDVDDDEASNSRNTTLSASAFGRPFQGQVHYHGYRLKILTVRTLGHVAETVCRTLTTVPSWFRTWWPETPSIFHLSQFTLWTWILDPKVMRFHSLLEYFEVVYRQSEILLAF
jgi:hypothetical protein